jgi:predicted nucleotidyltransferase
MPLDAEDSFDPVPVLEAFARGGIDFVVIGGVAGGVHGSAYGTYDVDLAYARDRGNLERIAEVLRNLDAHLRGAPADLPFQLDALSLEAGGNFTFATSMGSIDLLAYATGAPPYEELRRRATVIDIGGHPVRVASLDHLIAMKESTGRTKDKLHATEYRVISDELRAPRREM